MCLAESRAFAWNERVLAERGAEVARAWICYNLTRIAGRVQAAANELRHQEPIRPRHLDGSIQRRLNRDRAQGTGYVVCRNGLNKHRRHMNDIRDFVAVGD